MLLEFKIGNYLSFKEISTFSLYPASIKEHKETNIIESKTFSKIKFLKSAAIYGANASGKSNLFKAMAFMKFFVLNSSKETQAIDKIKVESYRLNFETYENPSHFEISIVVNDIIYKYGFEADKNEVKSEWLFSTSGVRQRKLFTRHNGKFNVAQFFPEGKGLENKTRSNALFLSVVAQFNGSISGEIIKWFNNFNVISGSTDFRYWQFTAKMLDDEKMKNKIIEFIKLADLGIEDIFVKTEEIPEEQQHIKISINNNGQIMPVKTGPKVSLNSIHKKYLNNQFDNKFEVFNFDSESEGTKKIFNLLGILLDTLNNDKILIIDELDSRLHPLLTREIVKLFHSDNNSSQLVFATHDTNLLDKNIFRRDQIWFTEKDIYGATHLYSLAEYKLNNSKVRNDASYEKDYILGYYGAIPYVSNFESLFSILKDEKVNYGTME